jgi:UDP-glucose 4-epimerase
VKILVTGGTGFIGKALVPRLRADGFLARGLSEAECPLRDYTTVESLIREQQPEVVIHLAAKTEVALSFDNYRTVSEVNYLGTINLAEACRKFVPGFKAFIMASTMETYGHQPEHGPFTETTEQRPMAPYAVAKLACEKYLAYMQYAYKFPSVILRQTNTYGRPDNDFFVVERIITQMLRSDACNLGSPEPWRNFLFIDDLVELYSRLLRNLDMALGETFVTGPDNALTIRDLADLIAGQLHWRGSINWHSMPDRPGEIFYLNSDPAKAQRVFDWKPQVPLAEGLRRTIEIWRHKLASVQV